MNPFNFDEEALRKEQEAADEKKGLLGVFGSALQDTVNVPSGYEMLYNKKIDRPDIKGSFDAVAKSIKGPTNDALNFMNSTKWDETSKEIVTLN